MTQNINLQEMLHKREKLKEKLKEKQDKIFKIHMILTKNKHERIVMNQEYSSLDRKIFEQTVGIDKIDSYHCGEVKKENKKILSESFIDSISKEMREKLIKRLQNRLDACEIDKYNKGLKRK